MEKYMNKWFSIQGMVKIFPMESAWFYVDIPLEKIPQGEKKGWGSVPVMATIGKTTWRTSLFPMKKDHYFIAIKKQVRIKEGIYEGDVVTISYTRVV